MQPSASADPEDRSRFRSEAEAVAQLRHPNIVQIYEVGEHAGIPYLSLEFVEGGSLGQRLTGTPQPPREAAHLLAVLARTVYHAHQAGIVHRDLKPGNILLSNDGTPKVADFGIAKRLPGQAEPSAHLPHTQTGRILGTPSYMAPEQAAGQSRNVGQATDVYSLGVILYEMLTGRVPFNGLTALDTLMLVRNEEPVPPRRLQPRVPHDLQTICLKCLQKDPARRYVSADALALDLERFLQGKPVEARPVPPWMRVWKWARRRPAPAALVVLSILAALSLLLTDWSYSTSLRLERDEAHRRQGEAEAAQLRESEAHRQALGALRFAREKEKEARQHHQEAETQRQKAQDRGKEARHQRDRARLSLAKACDAVEVMLSSVGDQRLADVPQMETLRRQLLEDALCFYQDFLRDNADDPMVRRLTARAFWRAGDVQRLLGNLGPAEQSYREALMLQERLLQEAPQDHDTLGASACIQNNLGLLLNDTGRFAEAQSWYEKAIGLHERLLTSKPEDAVYRRGLASNLNNLSIVRQRLGRLDDAESALRQSLQMRQQLLKENPNNIQFQDDVASCHVNLAVLFSAQHRPREAEAAHLQAIALLEPLVERFPGSSRYRSALARNHNNLSSLLLEEGNGAGAEKHARLGMELWDKLTQEFLAVTFYRDGLATSLTNLGAMTQGRSPPEAERLYSRALKLRQGVIAEVPASPEYRCQLGGALHNLAGCYARQSRLTEARRMFEEAITHQQAALQSNPQEPAYRGYLRNHYVALSLVLLQLGEHREAVAAAGRLAEVFPDQWRDSYRKATILARCIPLVEKDDRLPDKAREVLGRQYGAAAVAALRQAVRGNPKLLLGLARAPELTPLQSRRDFLELVRPAKGD